MITIGGIIVMVSNQKKAVDFYTKKLGFEKRVDMPVGEIHWIEVAPANSQVSISLMEPSRKMMSKSEFERARNSIGTTVGLWYYTDDLEATYKALKKKSVDITPPKKQDWGGIASMVKDQDGNGFNIVEFKI